MALYVGTNYHPHDWEPERWPTDIALMKEAGFTIARLGHLCWDSYEPEDGVYTFEWFDKVMDMFADAGIGVVLDISMRPAPRWVHKLCPGCDIYDKSGKRQNSLRRYMEDVDDPAYQKFALRFASVLVQRYKEHPALFAFALCNELGTGYISYSEYARQRFISWLKKKYGTVEKLNKAWTTQRWSRRLTSFDEVVLQENEVAVGPPEAWLDMRRFYSDGIGGFMVSLSQTVSRLAPGVPHSSNHYCAKSSMGFDYLKVCGDFVDKPGIGIYPGFDPRTDMPMVILLDYMCRLNEMNKPMWCLEFQSGRTAVHSDVVGINRMYAFLCLMHRTQMVLAWTFRTMLGGEEQFHHGLLDHDGTPTKNYSVFKRLAQDFKKLESYGFPYLPEPEIAVAYSYDNFMISQYHRDRFIQSYHNGLFNTLKALEKHNIDYNIVNLKDIKQSYKLLIVSGHIIMDEESAEAIKRFLENGGNVIMTGNSAIMDETAKVFATPKPGRLAEVFGVRNAGFFYTDYITAPAQEAKISTTNGKTREILTIETPEESFDIDIDYYEELELKGAKCIAAFAGKELCAISEYSYGKGKAYYIAAESNTKMLEWLTQKVMSVMGIDNGISAPDGICVRKISPNQFFYVNTTSKSVTVPLLTDGKGVLTGQEYKDEMTLAGYDGELIVG
jgi:beta-galactosidase